MQVNWQQSAREQSKLEERTQIEFVLASLTSQVKENRHQEKAEAPRPQSLNMNSVEESTTAILLASDSFSLDDPSGTAAPMFASIDWALLGISHSLMHKDTNCLRTGYLQAPSHRPWTSKISMPGRALAAVKACFFHTGFSEVVTGTATEVGGDCDS